MNKKGKNIQIALVIIIFLMTIVRFLFNEKGRMSPDSIRYLRFANGLPEVDNTITPMGYPFLIKLISFIGMDAFWSSKILGILTFFILLYFGYKKKFYFREIILMCALMSYLSIFSYTMSEAATLPLVAFLMYWVYLTFENKISFIKGTVFISLCLISLYNIRYSGFFFAIGTGVFGLLLYHYNKRQSLSLILSAIFCGIFVILYKIFFIDFFNENYVKESIITGLKSHSQLLTELFFGLATTFNPFIHIANPSGGILNIFIYGIGVATLLTMIVFIIKHPLSLLEKYMLTIGLIGLLCSYLVQYFYPVNALDYRLLSPFIVGIWWIFFRRLFIQFGYKTYILPILCLVSAMMFTFLSRGNYLENRAKIKYFLKIEKLENTPLYYYIEDQKDLEKIQLAELISTVQPNLKLTKNPKDTINKNTLTKGKILRKIKIDSNIYQ